MTPRPQRERGASEAGVTLVAAVLAAAIMMGVTYLYFATSWDGITVASERQRHDRDLYLAEAGVIEAIDLLDRGRPERFIDRADDARWSYSVRIADRGLGLEGQEIFAVTSTVESIRGIRTVDALVENRFRTPVLGGAVTVIGNALVTGGTVLDGRDHDSLGLGVVAPGVYGIGAGGDVAWLAAPAIGGLGTAPMLSPADKDGVHRGRLGFGDGTDSDGDGSTDEERFDGLDNDGDGSIDEDVLGIAAYPGDLFALPEAALEHHCRRTRRYFETASHLELWIETSHGGQFPGGEVIYLADDWPAADFGISMNADPSILVVHSSDGTAELSDMQGNFKGVIVADRVSHRGGNAAVRGALVSLGAAVLGNPLGLATLRVEYSSGALEDLPRIPFYEIEAWRDVPGVSFLTPTPPPDPGGLEGSSETGFQ